MMSVLAASEQQSHTKRPLCLSPPPLPQTGENKAPQAVAEMTRPQEHAGVAWGTMSSTVCAAQNNLLHKHQGREEIPRGAWRPRGRLARGGWEAQREGMPVLFPCQCHPSSHAWAASMLLPLWLPQEQPPPVRASLPTCLSLLSLDVQGKFCLPYKQLGSLDPFPKITSRVNQHNPRLQALPV